MEESAGGTVFLVLYAGCTIAEAQIVALTADPEIVDRFADMLPPEALEGAERRRALRLVPEPDDAA
jgi:hypothetical protein